MDKQYRSKRINPFNLQAVVFVGLSYFSINEKTLQTTRGPKPRLVSLGGNPTLRDTNSNDRLAAKGLTRAIN